MVQRGFREPVAADQLRQVCELQIRAHNRALPLPGSAPYSPKQNPVECESSKFKWVSAARKTNGDALIIH